MLKEALSWNTPETLIGSALHSVHTPQAVEAALKKDLDLWVGRTGRRKRSSQDEPSVVAQFMEDQFHLREDESIFDVLKALALPAADVSKAVATNAVRSQKNSSDPHF